jgi:hypothetical protein
MPRSTEFLIFVLLISLMISSLLVGTTTGIIA